MHRGVDRKGITLIELICVLAILSAVMAASAPRLAQFFAGRSLAEECRRFLALTRYARSEAVSSSVIMELWLNPGSGMYGLRPQVEYSNKGKKPVEFQLAEDFSFHLDAETLDNQGMGRIVFWPDGAIDEASLDELSICKGEEEMVKIVKADIGMGYVIKDE